MLPSPLELEYFLEVANALNISRAAERLGISQPSLSLAIKRLEQSIGTELLIRQQQGVTLTQAGKQLLLHTRQLIQSWENAKSHALASHQKIQGFFTVGCHSTIAIHSAGEFLPALLENNPSLEIQLKHDLSRKITEQIISLSIDLGIVVNPVRHPDLIFIKLCEDEVTFWIGPGKNKIQNPYSGDAIIICDPQLSQVQSLLKSKFKHIKYKRMIKTSSLEVVASLTAKGAGIGILPSRVAKAMYPNKLKRIANAPVYHDELYLVFRSENRNIYSIQVMINAIKNHFKKQTR